MIDQCGRPALLLNPMIHRYRQGRTSLLMPLQRIENRLMGQSLIDDNQQCYICHETANRILQVTKLEIGQYDDCGQYECCDLDACYTYIKNRIFCHAMIAGMEMLEADVYAAAHIIRVTRQLQS